MATGREKIESALTTKLWTTVRRSATSTFATKTGATSHSLFAIFNSTTGQLVVGMFDGARITGADAVGQIVTKINAT